MTRVQGGTVSRDIRVVVDRITTEEADSQTIRLELSSRGKTHPMCHSWARKDLLKTWLHVNHPQLKDQIMDPIIIIINLIVGTIMVLPEVPHQVAHPEDLLISPHSVSLVPVSLMASATVTYGP